MTYLGTLRDAALVAGATAVVAAVIDLLNENHGAVIAPKGPLPITTDRPMPHGWLVPTADSYARARPATAEEAAAGRRSYERGYHGLIEPATDSVAPLAPDDDGYPSRYGNNIARWIA